MFKKCWLIVAVALLGGASACTHSVKVRPTYALEADAVRRPGEICPHGEVVAVEASNRMPQPHEVITKQLADQRAAAAAAVPPPSVPVVDAADPPPS